MKYKCGSISGETDIALFFDEIMALDVISELTSRLETTIEGINRVVNLSQPVRPFKHKY